MTFILNVIADFMGNHRPLNGNNLDDYLLKALELGCPNVALPLLKHHRPMLYYPDPEIITKIVKYFNSNKNWENLKLLYDTIGKKM